MPASGEGFSQHFCGLRLDRGLVERRGLWLVIQDGYVIRQASMWACRVENRTHLTFPFPLTLARAYEALHGPGAGLDLQSLAAQDGAARERLSPDAP